MTAAFEGPSLIPPVLTLLLFLFPLAYSPGPGNMFFAANAARFGLRATARANAGYHIATWIVTAAIGCGFIVALDRFAPVFAVLKVAGSVYVLWIAWKLLKAGAPEAGDAARPPGFLDGAVLLVLNPKAYLIIALMFTQFLSRSEGGSLAAILSITTVFTLNNLMAFLVYAAIGDRIAASLRTPATARRLNLMFGTILAAVAVWMLLS